MSELAYINFENVFESKNEVSISESRDLFFSEHPDYEASKNDFGSVKSPLLLNDLVNSARFSDLKICRYVNDISREKMSQLSAVAFKLDKNAAFIAFRGTDSTLIGWKEDFDLSYISETAGQKGAVNYLNDIGRELNCSLYIGGHSKGGNFAVYASSFCDKKIQDRIIHIYSFDGPGFRNEIIQSDNYQRILPKVISFVPDTSVVGMLLSSECEHNVVKSTASGILQHDAFSWDISRNRFVRTQKTEAGHLIEKVLGDWLEQIDDTTRKSLTDTVFSVLESTGEDSFHGMSEKKWKSAEAVISSMADLPKEKRQELLKLTGKLIHSSGQTAVSLFFSGDTNK